MAWYDNAWGYRVKVTILHGQVAAGLTDFPVYVDLSGLPAGFFTHVKSDGGDIRVTTSDEVTECAREVVAINTGSSTGELHFLAPSLSSSVDTDFYIYYGNAAASEPAVTATYGRNAVWAAYGAVYHCNEASGNLTDATGNGNAAAASGTVTYGATGKIGSGVNLNGGYFNVASPSADINLNGSGYLISLWLNAPSSGQVSYAGLGAHGSTSNDWGIQNDGGGPNLKTYHGASSASITNGWSAITVGSLVKVDNAWDGTNIHLYKNGALYANGASTLTTTPPTTTYPLRIGASRDPNAIKGVIDEYRIRKSWPGANWVATEYNNQNDPATFFSIGSEVASGGGGTTVNLSGVSGTGHIGSLSATGAAQLLLLGQSGTGRVGTLSATGAANLTLGGQSGIGRIGNFVVTGAAAITLAGQSAQGQVGTFSVTGAANITLTGLSANGLVGTLQIGTGNGANVSLTGISGTGQAGSLSVTGAAQAALANLSAAGRVGSLTAIGGAIVSLSGLQGTGLTGSLLAKIQTTLTLSGVSATGRIGVLDITGGSAVTLSGITATGRVGSLSIDTGIVEINLPSTRICIIEHEDRTFLVLAEDRRTLN